MKLWKISQTDNSGYDTYDSAVVVAATADDAKKIHPDACHKPEPWWLNPSPFAGWCNSTDDVTATCIGDADQSLSAGSVVCASFNAG